MYPGCSRFCAWLRARIHFFWFLVHCYIQVYTIGVMRLWLTERRHNIVHRKNHRRLFYVFECNFGIHWIWSLYNMAFVQKNKVNCSVFSFLCTMSTRVNSFNLYWQLFAETPWAAPIGRCYWTVPGERFTLESFFFLSLHRNRKFFSAFLETVLAKSPM